MLKITSNIINLQEIKQYLESTDFPSLKNERILITAKGGVPDKLPVWVMRQAGRYLTGMLLYHQNIQ